MEGKIYGIVYECFEGYKWLVREESAFHKGHPWKDDMIGPMADREMTEIKFFRSYSGLFPIFIDVGAHVGYFTIRLAKYFEQVIAFEPNNKIRNVLKINLQLNNIKNVSVLPYALSDHYGESELLCRGGCGQVTNLGEPTSPVFQNLKEMSSERQKVNLTELSDVLISEFSFDEKEKFAIKIDTEGYEPAVINGAWGIMDNPLLWMVEHHANVYDLPEQVNKIKWLMKKGGQKFLGVMDDKGPTEEKLLFSNIVDRI